LFEAFDSRDLPPGDIRYAGLAGSRGDAINHYRAGATLTFAAAVLSTGQIQFIA